ncbi:MAG TPA: hypothetical protein VIK27_10485 [Candidatus Aquilonibacter sp.]
MKACSSALTIASLSLALALPAGAQSTSTISGKLVDIATYVTKDHNMDAMKGEHAMAGDHAMAGGDHAMAGGGHAMAPASCPPLGVVSTSGRVIMVAAQQGSPTAKELCAQINGNVTLVGTTYSQGGTTVFLVSSAK